MHISHWLLIGLTAATPVTVSAATQDLPAAPHYRVRLEVDPAARHIRVTGSLTLPARDTLTVFLHRQLEVRSFRVAGGPEHEIDADDHGIRYLPEAIRVRVPSPASRRGGRMEVGFEYEGTITDWPEWSASVIGPEWTEIGLYFPWFPYHPDLGPFTYELEVVHDPAYTVAAMGARETHDGVTTFRRSTPTNDMVVTAAPALQVSETRLGESTFRVAETELADATVDSILADVSWLQTFYGDWLGPVAGDLLLVASEREQGGGYARMGGLFLAGFEDDAYLGNRTGYLRYLGHELAHLWWYRADSNTWHDWLNESLAEYSALRAIRERVGKAEYRRRLAAKREEASGTPPIYGLDRNSEHAEAVLYDKGPVLLADLEDRIGSDRFRAFTRLLIEREVTTTTDFLDTLQGMMGREVRRWFEARLRDP
ncbi:MAG: M1 family aminopeptidase [Longimicrobiales bacterium]